MKPELFSHVAHLDASTEHRQRSILEVASPELPAPENSSGVTLPSLTEETAQWRDQRGQVQGYATTGPEMEKSAFSMVSLLAERRSSENGRQKPSPPSKGPSLK